MSTAVIAAAVARLEAKGMSSEDILDIVKDMLAAGQNAEISSPRRSSAAERQARYRERKASQTVTCDVTRDAADNVTCDVTNNACDVTSDASSRIGAPAEPELTNLEISRNKNKKHKTRNRVTYPSEFELLVHAYGAPERTVKLKAYELWRELSQAEQDLCMDAITPYNESLEADRRRGFDRTKCGLQVFINQRRWESLLSRVAA